MNCSKNIQKTTLIIGFVSVIAQQISPGPVSQEMQGPGRDLCCAVGAGERFPVLVKESRREWVGNGSSRDVPGGAVQGFGVFWDMQAVGMAVSQEGLAVAMGHAIGDSTRANLEGPWLLCAEI